MAYFDGMAVELVLLEQFLDGTRRECNMNKGGRCDMYRTVLQRDLVYVVAGISPEKEDQRG